MISDQNIKKFKTIVEVAAILIGGGWAFLVYGVSGLQNLPPSLSMYANSGWDNSTNDRYQRLWLTVYINNEGPTPFSVDEVRFRLWIVSKEPSGVASLLDMRSIVDGVKPIVDEVYSEQNKKNNALIWRYNAKTGAHTTFNVDVKCGSAQMYYYEVEAHRTIFGPFHSRPGELVSSGWGYICKGDNK